MTNFDPIDEALNIEVSRTPKISNVKKEDISENDITKDYDYTCLLYTSPSPRDPKTSRMPSSA